MCLFCGNHHEVFLILTNFGRCGSYTISLVPNSNYKLDCVETRNPLYNVASGFTLVINSCKFYAYQAKESIPEGPMALDLMECLILSKQISFSISTGNYHFTVPPSTMYITVFAQLNSAGSDTRYPSSMFKAPNQAGFGVYGDLTLSQLQLTYASINKPSTNWNSDFKALPQVGGCSSYAIKSACSKISRFLFGNE